MTSRALVMVVCLGAVAVGVLSGAWTVALMAFPIAWFCGRLVRNHHRRMVRRLEGAALCDLVDMIGQEVRSGASLQSAVATSLADPLVASLDGRLEPLASATAAGRTLDSALYELGDRTEWVELSLLATSVAVLVEHGGPVGPAIERLSELVRSIEAARLDARAQSSQATASAVVMAALPVVFGLVVALVDRRMADFYLRAPLGAVCVSVAAGLAALGWLWMERLIWGSS